MSLDRARAEIEALHARFEEWFRDDPEADFGEIAAALPPDFVFCGPNGETGRGSDLVVNLEQARGSRDITIRIENVQMVLETDDVGVARYEEWHDHADYTTTRQSTVVFVVDESRPHGLQWRLVQETWKTPPPHRA